LTELQQVSEQLRGQYSLLADKKREDEEFLNLELDDLKKRNHELLLINSGKDREHDRLKEEIRKTNKEVYEAKQDCANRTEMLEDHERKIQEVEEREETLKKREGFLAESKAEFKIDQEKLRLLEITNHKLNEQLKEQKEEYGSQLQAKVSKILESERKEHKKTVQQMDEELSELNSSKVDTEIRLETQAARADQAMAEVKQLRRQVETCLDERKLFLETYSQKLETSED
jgi:hypothetical protein